MTRRRKDEAWITSAPGEAPAAATAPKLQNLAEPRVSPNQRSMGCMAQRREGVPAAQGSLIVVPAATGSHNLLTWSG
jgi:hypothetical protein